MKTLERDFPCNARFQRKNSKMTAQMPFLWSFEKKIANGDEWMHKHDSSKKEFLVIPNSLKYDFNNCH